MAKDVRQGKENTTGSALWKRGEQTLITQERKENLKDNRMRNEGKAEIRVCVIMKLKNAK